MSSRSSTRTSGRTTATLRRLRLTALFRPEDILHNPEEAAADDVPRLLLEHLALEYGIGNLKAAMAEVAANMKKDDVHVCPGMAVIYGRLEKVDKPLVAMATSRAGWGFAGKRVFLVVAILIPSDMPGVYKQILHGLAKTCEADGAAASIASLPSPLTVWQHFEAGGHRLPDHLQARHIMSPPTVYLSSDDSLARAIDLFLAHRAAELPVLTPDRELIGVVTTRRLVKVCMPDYLMWVEDLSPFLNFEPIAEIIRNESSTWLREIMVQNFAHVVETSPAILALKEIGRRETDSAYVLRGRELVGVIHLHEFLGSVLR
ncbi:MAG: CBS domain-containing protein [Planctomycetaceae bacterium]|nr:CBS domain-containing protein [Planctomycetaceae bacterium]